MNLIRYPNGKAAYCPKTILISAFLYLLFLLSSLTIQAKTVIIGTGSGGFTQTSMGSLSTHDTLAITAGTYTASSCSFSNLDSITIVPYNGSVTFSGGGSVGFGANMVGDTWESLPASGHYFTFNNANIQFQSSHTQSCRFLYLQFTNCTNVCFDASNSSYYGSYVGTTASLMLYKTVIDDCKFTSCVQMVQGFYGTPVENKCISDSIEVAYDTVLNTTGNGNLFSGCFTHVNFHHNYIYYKGDNTQTGDVGTLYYNGDGQVHHNKLLYGRGYLTRVFMYSLGSTAGNFYFYDNLIYGQTEYGGLDIRCDTTQFGTKNPYMTKTNGHVYNNTEGNKTTVEGYITPLSIIGTLYYPSGNATVEVKNNFAFNVINVNNGYGDGSYFATNFSGGTWTEDTSNNQYATAAQALNFVQDTNSTWMPQASSYINANGASLSEPYSPTPDLFGYGYSNNIRGARANNTGAVTANAGSNQTITLPVDSVKLSGSGCSGTISSYLWTEVSGPNSPTIVSSTSVSTSVRGLITGAYVFQLKVSNSEGSSSTATVNVTVNSVQDLAPVVSAGSIQTITLPTSSVTLSGTATDSVGTITSYLWTEVSGPGTATIAEPSEIKTSVTGLVAGTYVFQLKVTNNANLATSATVTIVVDQSPAKAKVTVTATAKPATMTLPGNTTTLTATVSDPNLNDPTFNNWWSEQSGPNKASIASQPDAVTKVTGLIAGTYVFYISITDPNGTATTTVTVTVAGEPTGKEIESVQNQVLASSNEAQDEPLVADAGNDTTVSSMPGTAFLNGSASVAPTGDSIASSRWIELSGPSQSFIMSGDSLVTSVEGLAPGNYHFALTVTDIKGTVSNDTVKITVTDGKEIFESHQLSVYPDPVTSSFNFQIACEATGTMWIYVYDMRGNMLLAQQYSKPSTTFSTLLDASRFTSGTYILQAVIERKTLLTTKFVKL